MSLFEDEYLEGGSAESVRRQRQEPLLMKNDEDIPESALVAPTVDSHSDEDDDEPNDASSENDLERCHWGELISAFLSGFVFISIQHLPNANGTNTILFFLPTLCVVLGIYVVCKFRKHGLKPVAVDWGLTLDQFVPCFGWCSLVGIVGCLIISVWNHLYEKRNLPYNHHLLIMMILYPLWGCVQQFMIQDMIALNLSKTRALSKFPIVTYLLTALSFSMCHYGLDWQLVASTFFLGLCLTPIFLKHRCIYPLGIYHGWLGALFYWYVLKRDPLRS